MIPKALFVSFIALSSPHQQLAVLPDDRSIVESVVHQRMSIAVQVSSVATTNFYRQPEPPLLQQQTASDALINSVASSATSTDEYFGNAIARLDVCSHVQLFLIRHCLARYKILLFSLVAPFLSSPESAAPVAPVTIPCRKCCAVLTSSRCLHFWSGLMALARQTARRQLGPGHHRFRQRALLQPRRRVGPTRVEHNVRLPARAAAERRYACCRQLPRRHRARPRLH